MNKDGYVIIKEVIIDIIMIFLIVDKESCSLNGW